MTDPQLTCTAQTTQSAGTDEVAAAIDIRQPDVNVVEVMTRIRARLQARRLEAQEKGLDFDRLPGHDELAARNGHLSGDFYYDLHQTRQGAEEIWVSMSLMGDERYPRLLSGLIRRVRHAAHQLVLYYVNMLAGRQVNFNRSAAGALAGMAETVEQMAARIEALEREVQSLRATHTTSTTDATQTSAAPETRE
jgi:hypothetical protein